MSKDNIVNRGYMIPIGGNEDKLANPQVLERFIKLSGGKNAYIAIIPTASKSPDTGDNYVKLFKKMGAKNSYNLKVETRRDGNNADYIEHLNKATGIFMTGGNQLLLSTILGGTPMAQLIRRKNAAGAHVAGTSAGAAFMSEHMIAGGKTGVMPRSGMVSLSPGLGLTNKIIIDQHFSQRDRLGRLLTALSYNPFITGVGIDEDTGAFLAPTGIIEVVGSGMLTVVDMSELEYSSLPKASLDDAISLVGIKMHILTSGSSYDLINRKCLFKK